MPVRFLDLFKERIIDNPVLFCIIPDSCKFFRPFGLYFGKDVCIEFCLVKGSGIAEIGALKVDPLKAGVLKVGVSKVDANQVGLHEGELSQGQV